MLVEVIARESGRSSSHLIRQGLPDARLYVGATLVVALLADAARNPGDHKGRPYRGNMDRFATYPRVAITPL